MRTKTLTICASLLSLIVAWAVSPAAAADWGSIKGRFVLDGPPPTLTPLVVNKDQYCIDKKPVNQTVVVGDDGGLANAVVYIYLGRHDKIDINPEYTAQMSEPVELNNSGCSFHPHVVLVRAGQTLDIKNSDPVGHNTKIDGRKNTFNQTVPAGATIPYVVQQAEPMPAPISCSIHTFMKGVLVVEDHPYMVASADDGTFEIKDIPAGEHEFQFWHEASGYMKDLKFKGGSTDRRGRAKLTIPAGGTLDLGDIKVPSSLLQ
jgi:plastocyanin